jgi:hypothetical protein
MAAGKKRARLGIRRKATAQETVMAALTNAQQAQLLVDGAPVNADTPGVTSSDPAVASLGTDADGKFVVIGQATGSATITASYLGRSGTLEVNVSEEPYILSLGTPEPK